MIEQHNRLTTAKTVADGQLFTVESVPPETVFYGFAGISPERRADAAMAEPAVTSAFFDLVGRGTGQAVVTFGGDESTGRGVTALHWPGGGAR